MYYALSFLLAVHTLTLSSTHETTLDLIGEWHFQSGTSQGWLATDFDDSGWPAILAGKRWEDQGYSDLNGRACYRRTVEVPAQWQGRTVWLYLGGVNDACVVYCNGARIGSFGDEANHSFADRPVVVDLTAAVKAGAANVLAVEVNDWGGSGGLWRGPCLLTTDVGQLPQSAFVAAYKDAERREVTVDVDLSSLGNERPAATVHVDLLAKGLDVPAAQGDVPLAAGVDTGSVSLHVPDGVEMDGLQLAVSPTVGLPDQSKGAPLAGLSFAVVLGADPMPRWPSPYAKLKVLNSFVTQLLNATTSDEAQTNLTFANPRDGWVFISVTTAQDAVPPVGRLDEESADVIWRFNAEAKAYESMRLLSEGKHRLVLAPALPAHVTVRAIPEIQFCYYPVLPNFKAYGSFDWAYMQRHVLPHVNTLVTTGGATPEQFDSWLKEGRQWLGNALLPGLTDKEPPSPDAVCAEWAANPGSVQPGFGGVIVDEFVSQTPQHYQAWTEALKKLYEAPSFKDRTFYAWYGSQYQKDEALTFARTLVERNGMLVWERYLREEPAPEAARWTLAHSVIEPWNAWREAMPDLAEHMIMCLGYMSGPPESLNADPSVDYHVFMDMQFRLLATNPAFWGLHGIMEYAAGYADEESLRYAHKLIRHYCIEGSKEPFNTDPYRLPHLANPDFADGLKAWTVTGAEEGMISVDSMPGFSFLEGRYPRSSQGDQFCKMKRSPKGLNKVSQTVKALTPGRLYSVKAVAADLVRLGEKPTSNPLRISVVGGEVLPERGYEAPFSSCYAHTLPPYDKERPAWFTAYRVVFRATAAEAELSISEDPDGQALEVGFNFVEVQPFHE